MKSNVLSCRPTSLPATSYLLSDDGLWSSQHTSLIMGNRKAVKENQRRGYVEAKKEGNWEAMKMVRVENTCS